MGGGQDKGSCSHQLLSDCLHIFYSRDKQVGRETNVSFGFVVLGELSWHNRK